MQIKSYNPAVDPNTIHGSVQAPADANAYGANTSGSKVLQAGLNDVQKQWQAYIDDQISLAVVDASNKYHQGLNDLLNNPDTGLLTKQDINALDVMKQYQEGEVKIRQDALGSLPNYKKAHDAFLKMADDTNINKLGTVMQYQYSKQKEYKANVLQTRLDLNTNNVVEEGVTANVFAGFAKNAATIDALYMNELGRENLAQKRRDANTTMLTKWLDNIIADGSQTSLDVAGEVLSQAGDFVNSADLAKYTHIVSTHKKEADLTRRVDAVLDATDDRAEQLKMLQEGNRRTIRRLIHGAGGANGSNSYFEANASIESTGSGDYNAYNRDSGAFGKYQFLPSTWEWVSGQTGVNPEDHSPEAQDTNAKWYWNYLKSELNGDEEATSVAWNWGLESGKRWQQGLSTGIDDKGQEFSFNEPHKGNMAVTERIRELKKRAGNQSSNLVDEGFKYSIDAGLVGIQMDNGRNGCAEFVGKFGASYSEFLAKEAQNNVVYVPTMIQDAEAAGIPVVPFDIENLNKGDCIFYKTNEGSQGHIVIYDGNGGFYGNSSSTGPNGTTIHGGDINIPGMVPEGIIKTGISGTQDRWVESEEQIYSEEELEKELDARRALRKRIKQEAIEAKVTNAKKQYADWAFNHAQATDTERRQALAGIIGDDEDLKISVLGSQVISLDKSIQNKAEAMAAKSRKANVFDVQSVKAGIHNGKLDTKEKLNEFFSNVDKTFTPDQVNQIYTEFDKVQNGEGFDIGNWLTRYDMNWDTETWKANKNALDVIVGEEVNKYQQEHNGEQPDKDTIRKMVVKATTRWDTGATAEYGIFTDTPLKLSQVDVKRLGYATWDLIKTDEGTYVRFYNYDSDGNPYLANTIYATELPDFMKRNGIK